MDQFEELNSLLAVTPSSYDFLAALFEEQEKSWMEMGWVVVTWM
jgi:hypothetical protein